MNDNKIKEAWKKVEPDQEADERMRKAILRKNNAAKLKKPFFFSSALSLSLILIIAFSFLNDNSTDFPSSQEEIIKEEIQELEFNLKKSDSSIKVSYVDEVMGTETEASLVYLSEGELLAERSNGVQIAAFRGTIKAIHNLEVNFSYQTDYLAVVEVEIIEDYRTDLKPGTVITVMAPGHILDGGGSNTIMDTAGYLQVGAEAIMMPVHYDETAIYSVGEQTLYLQEIAEYGLGDGIRWLFVETSEGLVFAEFAYPSFEQVETLEDVAEIIGDY